MNDASEEEQDILHRSTNRTMGNHPLPSPSGVRGGGGHASESVARRSYQDSVVGDNKGVPQVDEDVDGDVSDDDVVDEGGETWFGIGMTMEEKIATRRPWRNSLIIKLVGRSIGYQYLLKRIQAM